MNKNPIEKAVAPLKKDAMDRARMEGTNEVERVREELAEAGWDINEAAPYPKSSWGYSVDYHMKRARYQRFHALVTADPSIGYQSNRPGSPYIVVIDEAKAQRYIEMRVANAAADYEAFVRKLVAKIGDTKKAVLDGNHVWGHSILIVTMPDGEKQAWKTQQIVNYSKLGKMFNQWPTRRLKKVPETKKAAA